MKTVMQRYILARGVCMPAYPAVFFSLSLNLK